jgi:hypothetical protein
MLVVFLSPTKKILEQYFKVSHNCFLSHPSGLIFNLCPPSQCYLSYAVKIAWLKKLKIPTAQPTKKLPPK